ncbi:MAG: hypothetical protein DDT37_01219 [Firmicutes bacterium]|nr:hypothetical protein [candidate division NPL-UPA2 bacterium]
MAAFTESTVEQAALAWLENMGYLVLSGPEIATGEVAAEREHYGQVWLPHRLRQALQRLNPRVRTLHLAQGLTLPKVVNATGGKRGTLTNLR